jgi:hypothetical protein
MRPGIQKSSAGRPELAAIPLADPSGALFKAPEKAGQVQAAYAGTAADAWVNPSGGS